MIECVRRSSRNVKYWQNGDMCLRWTAAGMLKAEQQFRRIIGYHDLAKLAARVEREVTLHQLNPLSTQEAATAAAASSHHTRTATEVPHRPEHPPTR